MKSLKQVILETIQEGYKKDSDKLASMRRSGTRGTGLSSDDQSKKMKDKTFSQSSRDSLHVKKMNEMAKSALTTYKSDFRKVTNIFSSTLESVIDGMNFEKLFAVEKNKEDVTYDLKRDEFRYTIGVKLNTTNYAESYQFHIVIPARIEHYSVYKFYCDFYDYDYSPEFPIEKKNLLDINDDPFDIVILNTIPNEIPEIKSYLKSVVNDIHKHS